MTQISDILDRAVKKKISVVVLGPPGCGKLTSVLSFKDSVEIYPHIDRFSTSWQIDRLNEINRGKVIFGTAYSTENIYPALVDQMYLLHHPTPSLEDLIQQVPDSIDPETAREIAIASNGSWRQLQILSDMPFSQSDAFLRSEAVFSYLNAVVNGDLLQVNKVILDMRNLSLLPNAAISLLVDMVKDIITLKVGIPVNTYSGLTTTNWLNSMSEARIKVLLDISWAGLSKVTPLSTNYSVLWLMAVKAIETIHSIKFDSQFLASLRDF